MAQPNLSLLQIIAAHPLNLRSGADCVLIYYIWLRLGGTEESFAEALSADHANGLVEISRAGSAVPPMGHGMGRGLRLTLRAMALLESVWDDQADSDPGPEFADTVKNPAYVEVNGSELLEHIIRQLGCPERLSTASIVRIWQYEGRRSAELRVTMSDWAKQGDLTIEAQGRHMCLSQSAILAIGARQSDTPLHRHAMG